MPQKSAKVRMVSICTLVLLPFVPGAGIAQEQMARSANPGSSFTLKDRQPAATSAAFGTENHEGRLAQSVQPASPVQSETAETSGSIRGTVVDARGDGVAAAQIILTNVSTLQKYTLASGPDGEFTFTEIPPGMYFAVVKAKGFATYTSPQFTLSGQQIYDMPKVQLAIAVQVQQVTVRPTEVIAQMQIKAEEKQRTLGVFPEFYTSYVWDAAPLSTKQKFSLATRDFFDPVPFILDGAVAGLEQANNSFAGYGQGAAGYGKRYAAALGNDAISDYLSHAIFPSIFHQDPRYFYQGTGSMKSRLVHALSWAVILRSDSGHPMPNYSYLLGDLAAGALSNLYYPPKNRGAGLVFTNAAIGIAGRAGTGVIREFVLKHLVKNVPGNGKP